MFKFSVFLSSAMTGELNRERDSIRVLFETDPTLSEFFELYAIEEHASPQPIEKAFTDQVKKSSIFIILLDKQLREAVKTEFFTAKNNNIKIFIYIRNRTDKRDDDLMEFISQEAYKFHCGSFTGSVDLYKKVKDDIRSDLVHKYDQAINAPIQDTEYEAVSVLSEKAWSSSRYYDHHMVAKAAETLIIKNMSIDQLIALAMTRLEETGNLKESLLLNEIILYRDPKNWQAFNNRGLILHDMGYSEDALFSYRCALKLNPASHATLYNIGNYYRLRHRYDEALNFYLSSLSIKPDKLSALGHIVSIFLDKRDCSNALEYAEKAYSIERGEAAIANLCMALTICNKKVEALEKCEELKEFTSYRKFRAYIFYFCNDFEDALPEIEMYFREGHRDYDLAIKKLYCLINSSKFEQAISWFREVELSNYIHPIDLNNIGWILFQKRALINDSLELLQRAVDEDPSILAAWKNLQCALGEVGKFKEALMVSNNAINYYPDDPGIIMNRSKFLLLNGNLRECINYISNEFSRLFGAGLSPVEIETMINESIKNSGLNDIESFEKLFTKMIALSKTE